MPAVSHAVALPRGDRFATALAVSLVAHALVLALVRMPEGPSLPGLLQVTLRAAPQLIAPEPVADVATPVQPVTPPAPRPAARAPELRSETATVPAAHDAAPPAPAQAEVPAPSTAAAVIAMPPAGTPAPVVVAQTPPAIEARGEDEAIGRYGSSLSRALDATRNYPRLALARRWQGTVEMRVEFRKGGLLGEVLVVRSSGHQVLDEQAREMVRSAELPPVAAELRNRDFSINVPVVFRLN